jgi:hypothetical protein
MLGNFPLLVVSFAIYNMVVFLTPGVGWSEPLYTIHMMSGAAWTVTSGDALIGLSLLFLFFRIDKAARAGSHSIADHLLSTIVFVAALVEFLLVREAGTSVFCDPAAHRARGRDRRLGDLGAHRAARHYVPSRRSAASNAIAHASGGTPEKLADLSRLFLVAGTAMRSSRCCISVTWRLSVDIVAEGRFDRVLLLRKGRNIAKCAGTSPCCSAPLFHHSEAGHAERLAICSRIYPGRA